jgi:hypothetical protein
MSQQGACLILSTLADKSKLNMERQSLQVQETMCVRAHDLL